MANAVLTAKNAPGVTAKLVAANLVEKVKFIKSISKEDASTFGNVFESASPGDTIQIKKPARFTVGSSLDITSTMQDVKQEKVSLTLNKLANVAFKMTSLETAYDKPIKYWNDEFVAPAVNALAADLDKWALATAVGQVANLVGTAGTQPGAIVDFLNSARRLYENLSPEDDQVFSMITPSTNVATVDARKGLFQNSALIAEQYKNGYIGQGEGLTYLRSNLLPSLTNGTATGTITVTTTSVNGATTIALTGTGTQTLKAGQVFTIANVYEVHPLTKAATSQLKQFVVTADNTAVAGAFTGVAISPTIYDSTTGGSLQNVSALPASGATVTLFGAASTTYAQNLIYHKDAFRFVSVPLYTPTNQDFAGHETFEGVSVRVLRGFDIKTSESIMRFDVLAALAAVRPEWACRLTGLN